MVYESPEVRVAEVTIKPKGVADRHEHPDKHVGVINRGSLILEKGPLTKSLSLVLLPGDYFIVESNEPHGAHAGEEGVELIQTYIPVKQNQSREPYDWFPGPPSDIRERNFQIIDEEMERREKSSEESESESG